MRLTVPGLPETDGVIDFLSAPETVLVHTPNGILMLLKGRMDVLFMEYHGFSGDEDDRDTGTAYQSWLGTAFA